MNYHSIIHLQGALLCGLAVAMLLPIPFSLYYGAQDVTALLTSAIVTGAIGAMMWKTTGIKHELRLREGFAVVTIGWLAFSIFGSLPYLFSGVIPSFTDAFFETMSGFTTTGATIIANIDPLPQGILFWRSLTHWLGGMGIIVLSLAILPFLGVGGMQLFKAEVPGPVADKLTPRVTETAKILWGVYALLTAAETLLLLLGGMSLFDALCHSFGTVATGGYSTRNASVGDYQSAYIDYVITFFMVLAGANFALHYRFLRGDWSAYWRDKEFRIYLGIIGAATLLIGGDLWWNTYGNVPQAVQYALFQTASIQTTTGFATADYEQWSTTSQLVLLLLMFVGGCAGSTSGGMKVMRLYLLVKFALGEFTRLLHPSAVVPVRINRVAVSRDVVFNVLGFFVLYIFLTGLGVFAMTLCGLDFATAFGATVTTLGNVGPGLGTVGPSENFAHLPAAAKWILSLLMLLGRLEIFTVLVFLSPAYWRR
ncbi:MAG: TrkH family potassium uptake protein [Caldilinea sp. CFX5]|nr:TrkH family potassium uptake protein [Caldilinea sp. CFX5]